MTPTTNEQLNSPAPPGGGSQGSQGGLTEAARGEAGHLKDTTIEASQQVAGTAKEKAADVASDVREQTQRLVGETRDQFSQQAVQQRDKAVETLRSVGDELREMAQHGQSGWGSQLVRHGAQWTDQAADFLQDRSGGEILDDVRRLARKRPGAFLLTAAVAGIAAGRLSRAMAAGKPEPDYRGNGYSAGMQSSYAPQYGNGNAGQYGGQYGGVYEGTTGGYSEGMGTAPTGGLAGPAGPGDRLDTPDYLTEPTPTPVAPDPDPGAPVQPRFGPGSGR